MKYLKAGICLHVLGLTIFNTMGLLNKQWTIGYFIWDKSVGCGFVIWMALYFTAPKNVKWMVRPVLLLSIIRFIWQILAYWQGWDINHQWWLALFFIILSLSAAYLTLKENSRPNTWLSKHLKI